MIAFRAEVAQQRGDLTMLCRYHNGTNDDDPEHTSRYGRIVRRNGTLMWLSPKGRLHPVEATPLEEIPPDLLPAKPPPAN